MRRMRELKRALRVRNAVVRECMSEVLGTFVLLLFGCAAGAQVKTSREMKGQFLSVNIAFSVGIMSAMYLCRAISGAHLNPAVSFSFCLLGRLQWRKLLPYSLSQVLGAYLASAVAFIVYYDAIMEYGGGKLTVTGSNETASIFATYPTDTLSLWRSFVDQVVGTAMLLLCILPLDDKRNSPAPDALLPPIVATAVLGISISMSSNCGGAINPARDFGPRLFTLTAGWGTEVFTCFNYWFWVPLVGPMVGSVLGTGLYLIVIQWQLPDPVEDSSSVDSPDTTLWEKQPKPLEGMEPGPFIIKGGEKEDHL